jgi:hypothetical protein
MKRLLLYAWVGLITACVGVALTIWLTSRAHVKPTPVEKILIKSAADKDDAIELVMRDLIERYPAHPVYFLSFAETDPSDDFMRRFRADHRIKRLSQAIQKANQVIDPESGVIGVHVQVGIYYPLNENEVRVGATWEFVEPVGKDPGWQLWPVEYLLRRVNKQWVITSFKIVPPLTQRAS